MISSLRIIVSGLIAQHPLLPGVTWDYLQYLIGLQQLGHDVYYLEDTGEWPYNTEFSRSGDGWTAGDCTANVDFLGRLMDRFGFGDRWAYFCALESKWFGLPDVRRRDVIDSADLLINVSGMLECKDEYRRIRRLAYIDSDPVFTQIKLAIAQAEHAPPELAAGPEGDVARQVVKDSLTLRDRVSICNIHFSFGEQLPVALTQPTLRWHPTRQPIALSEWKPSTGARDVFTTVMNWTSYEPIWHNGVRYGQKDVEMKRFLRLPQRTPDARFEVALSQIEHHAEWESADEPLGTDDPEVLRTPARNRPAELLRGMGWQVIDSAQACNDIDGYRGYIESSMAEWSVAKNGYVVGQAGWFSDRSACYLAAGKPVVVQDTGFAPFIPVGEGVVTFATLDEAAAGIESVQRAYARHSEAARAIAETYFDARKVLTRLVEEAMRL
jgi:hypothetical protein